jgi:hypothetical protein
MHTWGARHTRAAAERVPAQKTMGERKEWADTYHKRWWIEEIDTTGLFEIPTAPPTAGTIFNQGEGC